ncbi:MAG: carboxylating nicotinate-nucleotide diphosphorylase [Phycisphaerae bacterium]
MGVAEDRSVLELIALARCEDLGAGDITTGLIDGADGPARFRLVALERGVFAGRAIAPLVLGAYDPAIDINFNASAGDGAAIASPPVELATIVGPLGSILAAERVLLNFLQRLSGVATLTRAYVDAVAGTGAAVYDTRKTTPGWRVLEKYAVRCGGGSNHRFGLDDAVLIKDNHVAGVPASRLAGAVFDMLNRLPTRPKRHAFVEVEVDTLEQLAPLLAVVGIDVILLDNFSIDALRQAVALRDDRGLRGKVALEASGGVTLATVRAVAETGVERIAVGAITHAAVGLNMSMERL